MKRFLIFSFIILSVCLLSVTAFAESNNINFIDFNEYATYSYTEDNTGVVADVVFPDFFNNTFIAQPSSIGEEWYTGNSFTVDINGGQYIKLRMYPISGYTNIQMASGVQLHDTNVIDLRYIPNHSTLNYSFSVAVSSDNRYIAEPTLIFRSLFFVDENGLIIKENRHYYYPEVNRGILTWNESITLDYPSGAVGLVPMFWISSLPTLEDTFIVNLQPFQFVLPMSALEFDSMQNQQIKDTLKNVQDSIGELDNSIDNAVNGDFDVQTPDNSAEFDDLHDTETEIIGSMQNYLDNGIGFFDNAVGILFSVSAGFDAIKLIIAPAFNLPFVNGLILVSVSLGLIGTLLGLASLATSSVYRKSDFEKRKKAYNDGYRAGFTKKHDKE